MSSWIFLFFKHLDIMSPKISGLASFTEELLCEKLCESQAVCLQLFFSFWPHTYDSLCVWRHLALNNKSQFPFNWVQSFAVAQRGKFNFAAGGTKDAESLKIPSAHRAHKHKRVTASQTTPRKKQRDNKNKWLQDASERSRLGSAETHLEAGGSFFSGWFMDDN